MRYFVRELFMDIFKENPNMRYICLIIVIVFFVLCIVSEIRNDMKKKDKKK